jgi:hypothetical protein
MRRSILPLSIALALGTPQLACVVIDAPRAPHYDSGPPPHAPAHGYRRKHHGHDHVWDADLGVYVVVGLPGVWFLDGHYFRLASERWEVSAEARGPWRLAALASVPVRLVEKHHPHGAPPGQVKKHASQQRR